MILKLAEKDLRGYEGCVKSFVTESVLVIALLTMVLYLILIVVQIDVDVGGSGKVAQVIYTSYAANMRKADAFTITTDPQLFGT